MIKGQRVNNIGVCLPLRKHLNRLNLSVIDVGKVLGLTKETTLKLLRNPYRLTFHQLYLLSGKLNIDFLELCALIHFNKTKTTLEDKEMLSSLVEKYSEPQ